MTLAATSSNAAPARLAAHPVTNTRSAVRAARRTALRDFATASAVTQQVFTDPHARPVGIDLGVPRLREPLADLLRVGHRHLAAEELRCEPCHPRNPISRSASAAATIAAVSVRSTTGPKVATATPLLRASSSSTSEKPGSGPIRSVAWPAAHDPVGEASRRTLVAQHDRLG